MMVILIANGYVSQRYPNYDYEDVPFPNLDLFWQPNGWKLTKKRKHPIFFIFVLTSEHGGRLYCPCLCFSEPFQSEKSDEVIVYAPKCLVFISKYDLPNTFRKVLQVIHSKEICGEDHNEKLLETFLGKLLSLTTSDRRVLFNTLGANERQLLNSNSPEIPKLPRT